MIACNASTTLTMTRGDSATFHFHREDAEGKIITTKATAVYFTVKADAEDEAFIFQKTLDDMAFGSDSEYHFTINPEDTNGQDYGNYVYDLEVIRNDGTKQTIAKGIFKLTWESTWASNEEAA